MACERAPTSDPVIASLRAAFQVLACMALRVLKLETGFSSLPGTGLGCTAC